MYVCYAYICTYVLCKCVWPVYCIMCVCRCVYVYVYLYSNTCVALIQVTGLRLLLRLRSSDDSHSFVASYFVFFFYFFLFVFPHPLFSLGLSHYLISVLSRFISFSLLDPKPMTGSYFPSCVRSAYRSSSEFALPLSAAVLHVGPSDSTFLQATAYASL